MRKALPRSAARQGCVTRASSIPPWRARRTPCLYPGLHARGSRCGLRLRACENHAFLDGNKRAAFLAIGLFLAINGRKLVADKVDAIQTMLAVAAGDLDEKALAAWIQKNAPSGSSFAVSRRVAKIR